MCTFDVQVQIERAKGKKNESIERESQTKKLKGRNSDAQSPILTGGENGTGANSENA